jgi:hypothetical protein
MDEVCLSSLVVEGAVGVVCEAEVKPLARVHITDGEMMASPTSGQGSYSLGVVPPERRLCCRSGCGRLCCRSGCCRLCCRSGYKRGEVPLEGVRSADRVGDGSTPWVAPLGTRLRRRLLADLFFSGKCGGGMVVGERTTTRAIFGESLPSPPSDEADGDCLGIGDEREDVGDLVELLEEGKSSSRAEGFDVGVPGAEVFDALASKSGPFLVGPLWVVMPAPSRKSSPPPPNPPADWSAEATIIRAEHPESKVPYG